MSIGDKVSQLLARVQFPYSQSSYFSDAYHSQSFAFYEMPEGSTNYLFFKGWTNTATISIFGIYMWWLSLSIKRILLSNEIKKPTFIRSHTAMELYTNILIIWYLICTTIWHNSEDILMEINNELSSWPSVFQVK